MFFQGNCVVMEDIMGDIDVPHDIPHGVPHGILHDNEGAQEKHLLFNVDFL